MTTKVEYFIGIINQVEPWTRLQKEHGWEVRQMVLIDKVVVGTNITITMFIVFEREQ